MTEASTWTSEDLGVEAAPISAREGLARLRADIQRSYVEDVARTALFGAAFAVFAAEVAKRIPAALDHVGEPAAILLAALESCTMRDVDPAVFAVMLARLDTADVDALTVADREHPEAGCGFVTSDEAGVLQASFDRLHAAGWLRCHRGRVSLGDAALEARTERRRRLLARPVKDWTLATGLQWAADADAVTAAAGVSMSRADRLELAARGVDRAATRAAHAVLSERADELERRYKLKASLAGSAPSPSQPDPVAYAERLQTRLDEVERRPRRRVITVERDEQGLISGYRETFDSDSEVSEMTTEEIWEAIAAQADRIDDLDNDHDDQED